MSDRVRLLISCERCGGMRLTDWRVLETTLDWRYVETSELGVRPHSPETMCGRCRKLERREE